MPDRSTLDLLEETYRMVRLHGWCDQTYTLLRGLSEAIEASSPDVRSTINQTVRDRVGSSAGIDERVLSLVVLYNSGTDADAIADLAFQHVHGRLRTQSFGALLRLVFENSAPIPSDVNYDITKRVFISFQRAIFQAMQIEEFHSERSADHVVLYLTLLLCRPNLNEQNRAIVYLLLSRIDEPLPSLVEQAVTEGMVRLRDVIEEVQERQQSVLSDTLRPDTERSALQWERGRGLQSEVNTAKATRVDSQQVPAQEAVQWKRNVEAPPKTTDTIAAPPGIVSVGKERDRTDWEPERAPDSDRPDSAPKIASSGGESTVPADRLERRSLAAERPTSRENQSATEREQNGEEESAQDEMRPRNETKAHAHASRSTAQENDGAAQRFSIRFTRKSKELENLLDRLEHRSETGLVQGEANDDVPPRRASVVARLIKAPWRFISDRWWLIALLFAALAAGTLLLVVRERPNEESPAPTTTLASRAESANTSVASESAADSDVIQPETANEQTEFTFVTRAGRTIWVPRRGDSLWLLFEHFQANDSFPAGLPSTVSWQRFLRYVSDLNPAVREMDIILPLEEIVLE